MTVFARRGGRSAVVTGGLLTAVLVAGCETSVSFGERSVQASSVEAEILARFGSLFPEQSPAVECPDSLRARIGVTMRCELTDPQDGMKYPVNITVNSVEGANTKFDIDLVGVAAVAADDVERQIARNFRGRFDRRSLPVDCPSPLRAKVGVGIECTLTDPADGRTYPVQVTVDSVDGANTNFSFDLGDATDV